MIKQFRPFYFVRNKTLKYEIVGGLVDKGESLITALKREIKEEIGVKTKKVVKLTTYCPLPGYSDEIVHVYYAEVEKIKLKTLYNRNENEEIKIFKLSLTELKKIKYEIVGGLVDKGESLITALKREIKEEIGVNTKKILKLTTYCPVPGYSDEIVHVYYAEVEKIKLKNFYNRNENEEIKIFKLSLAELKKINESRSIQNVLTKISIYEYLKKFKKS